MRISGIFCIKKALNCLSPLLGIRKSLAVKPKKYGVKLKAEKPLRQYFFTEELSTLNQLDRLRLFLIGGGCRKTEQEETKSAENFF